jgi:hypothetical protein
MVAGDNTPASLGVGKPLFFTNAHTELDRGVENVPLFVPVVIIPAANRRCSSFSPIKKLKQGAFFSAANDTLMMSTSGGLHWDEVFQIQVRKRLFCDAI